MLDDFRPETMLHTCHLKVEWGSEGAVQKPLTLKLTLKGAKEPHNYLMLECGERGTRELLVVVWLVCDISTYMYE